ncbi:MAG: RNA polymerase factor sigma-54 [Cohaesibacteraceae bacterium]
MGMSPKLVLRQNQQLAITPQLMQAIKLLQLSSLELSSFVERELMQNPLLERDDADRDPADSLPALATEGPEPISSSDDPASGSDEQRPDWTSDQLEVSAQSVADNLDTAADNVFPEDAGPQTTNGPSDLGSLQNAGSQIGNSSAGSDGGADLDSYLSRAVSLQDHLTEQLHLAVSDARQRLIGQMLIDAIDDNGYLRADVSDLATRLGTGEGDVEDVLGLLQTFDPCGVGARSVGECLSLQLADKNRFDPAMAALMEHLDLVARRDFAKLRKLCGVDQDDLVEMVEELRALDPKPGRAFTAAPVEAAIPDLFVQELPEGGWGIELNSDTLPRVLVNRTYYAQIDRSSLSVDDRTYLSEQLQAANWLVKSLDQRARTIIKVGAEIVRQQDGFFAHGVDHLKPLTLRQVADSIEMHESTVSRVTSNKYVATPRGVFELKYFFTAAIQSADGGEAHAAEAVRQRIRKLIDAEDPKKILSAAQLVQLLRNEGIDIARRTVAKYRESLKIASSVQRRREKRAALPA